jgi:uncharacterized delta-60 repeat protein
MRKHSVVRSTVSRFSRIFVAAPLLVAMLATSVAHAAPGDPDHTFGNGGVVISPYTEHHDFPYSMAVQADEKILVGGLSLDSAFSLASSYIVRHLPNGALDVTFGVGGKLIFPYTAGTGEYRYRVIVQPDGKILACGGKENGSVSNTEFTASRYNPDGTLDQTFGTGGKVVIPITNAYDEAYDLVLQPDGKIVLFGYSFVSGSAFDLSVARLNANGSLDDSFDGDGKVIIPVGSANDIPAKVLLQPDGKIILISTTVGASGQDNALVRLNSNGSLDSDFGTGGIVINSLAAGDDVGLDGALQSDGKIVTSGGEVTGGGGTDVRTKIVRYSSNGSVDTTFASSGVFTTEVGFFAGNAIALQTDGKIIGFGFGLTFPGVLSDPEATDRPARKDPGPGGPRDLMPRPVKSSEAGGESSWGFATVRLTPSGAPDLSIGPEGRLLLALGTSHNDYGFEVVIQPDRRILVTGTSHTATTGDNAIVRYLGDTSVLRPAPFDFDGDGQTDISIFRPEGSVWWYTRSSDNSVRVAQFGASGDVVVPADYTGDGKDDIAVWRTATGEWYVLRSEDHSYYAFPFGSPGDTPAPADYDGDRRADAAVFRHSNATWYIEGSSAGTMFVRFGLETDMPVPADYDGDSIADIAIWRPSAGQWWYRSSGDHLARAVQFGSENDRAVPGDYTGDGVTDFAVWRPSNGYWFILRSEDLSYYAVPFGLETDIPAPGDYDGDGKYDTTVFRSSTGTWYSNRSTSGLLFVHFGTAGDFPVPYSAVR